MAETLQFILSRAQRLTNVSRKNQTVAPEMDQDTLESLRVILNEVQQRYPFYTTQDITGQSNIDAKSFAAVSDIWVRTGDISARIEKVDMRFFLSAKIESQVSYPRIYTLDTTTNKILLWPEVGNDYTVRIRGVETLSTFTKDTVLPDTFKLSFCNFLAYKTARELVNFWPSSNWNQAKEARMSELESAIATISQFTISRYGDDKVSGFENLGPTTVNDNQATIRSLA